MQIGLLEPLDFSAEARSLLASLGGVSAFDGNNLPGFLAPLDALFIRLAYRIDATFLQWAPRLRWICSPTTGHNHLDEQVLMARGIELLSLRGEREFLETIRATPEHTFGLMLALLRRYSHALPATLTGEWNRDACRGEELAGMTVGIIGLGRVGYRLAKYCDAFDAKVVWCDPADVPAEMHWQRLPDAGAVIAASKMVILCASYKAGQTPIIGKSEIDSLRNRYLVNTARGELIDEAALFNAVRENRLLGLALDVLADEQGQHQLAAWRELAMGKNLILTPHIGGATFTSMARTEIFIAEKLRAALYAQHAHRHATH